MTDMTEEKILKLLQEFKFSTGKMVVERISKIIIHENNVGFSIDVANIPFDESLNIQKQITSELSKIENIGKISIILTKNSENPKSSTPSKTKYLVQGAKKIILIVAGKGGVGKSTITSILAQQLTCEGIKVGIVDADIYGPSIPHIFGIFDKPQIQNNQFIPVRAGNIQIMSIGFLIKNNDALAWRGPMVSKVLQQLFNSAWSELDYLFVDMPPGTGDIHLSLCENYIVSGAIIVTAPQKLSYIDASKAAKLLNIYNIPILGIIENMSNPSAKDSSFSSGKSLAADFNSELISQVNYNNQISVNCDEGKSLINLVKLPLEFLKKL